MLSKEVPSSITAIEDKLDYWKRFSALERGRNQVLKMAATGRPLKETLQRLCTEARLYNPEMFCSVLLLNADHGTLHPIADDGLPAFYCEALDGVKIGQGVGSCGSAAFAKKRVIVDDIGTHPYWVQYKDLAQSAGLQACWSEPILGENGRCFGTFAMYYATPTSPSDEDIKFIEMSANLAAVVFENVENRQQLESANHELTQTLDERSQKLAVTIKELELALKEQGQAHSQHVNQEKNDTTRSLVVGLAHEFNTPVGIAVTSMSSARDIVDKLAKSLDGKEPLSRKAVIDTLNNVSAMLTLGENNLARTTDLINRFKSINVEEFDKSQTHFNILVYFNELKDLLKGLLKDHHMDIDVESHDVFLAKHGLTQILLQLIDNSIIHGFENMEQGVITVHARVVNDQLIINYQDNGCGITQDMEDKIFDPFFAGKKGQQSIGLGLNVASNIVQSLYHGQFCAQRAPVGARFEIMIPLVPIRIDK